MQRPPSPVASTVAYATFVGHDTQIGGSDPATVPIRIDANRRRRLADDRGEQALCRHRVDETESAGVVRTGRPEVDAATTFVIEQIGPPLPQSPLG